MAQALAQAPAQAFASSQRIKDFVTLAYSTLLNPRSLEGFWYPSYTQTISDLFNFPIPHGSLCAAERFYLYIGGERLRALRHEFRHPNDDDSEYWRPSSGSRNGVDFCLDMSEDSNNGSESRIQNSNHVSLR